MVSTQIARNALTQEVEDQRNYAPAWTRYEWIALVIITLVILTYFVASFLDPQNYTLDYNLKAGPDLPPYTVFTPGLVYSALLGGFYLVMTSRLLIAGANTFNRKAQWHNTLKGFQSGQLFRLKL